MPSANDLSFPKYLKHIEPYVLMLQNRMEDATGVRMTDMEAHAYMAWAANRAINVIMEMIASEPTDGEAAAKMVAAHLAKSASESAALYKAGVTGKFAPPSDDLIRFESPTELQERLEAGLCPDPNCTVDHSKDNAPKASLSDYTPSGYL